jgi:hypothetical protein
LLILQSVECVFCSLRLVEHALLCRDFDYRLSTAALGIIRKDFFKNSLTSGAMRVKISSETRASAVSLYEKCGALRFAV